MQPEIRRSEVSSLRAPASGRMCSVIRPLAGARSYQHSSFPMPAKKTVTPAQYERLAALRQALRRFLGFSAVAARRAGLPPQQHQALLAIKGFPGRDYVSIRELAAALELRHHSAVG